MVTTTIVLTLLLPLPAGANTKVFITIGVDVAFQIYLDCGIVTRTDRKKNSGVGVPMAIIELPMLVDHKHPQEFFVVAPNMVLTAWVRCSTNCFCGVQCVRSEDNG